MIGGGIESPRPRGSEPVTVFQMERIMSTKEAAVAQPKAAVDPDHAEVQAMAQHFYGQMLATHRITYPDQNSVHKAFVHAKLFLRTAAKIESGEMPCNPPEEEKPEWVDCEIWETTGTEDDGITPKFKVLRDPLSGAPVKQRMLVDHDAFCAALPDGHPINRRFKPRPGAQTLAEIREDIARTRKEIEDSNERVERSRSLVEKLGDFVSV
jgi:hypothetical protein